MLEGSLCSSPGHGPEKEADTLRSGKKAAGMQKGKTELRSETQNANQNGGTRVAVHTPRRSARMDAGASY